MLDNSTVLVLVYQPLGIDPWGTPVVTGLQLDFVSLTSTLWIWPLSCMSAACLEGSYRYNGKSLTGVKVDALPLYTEAVISSEKVIQVIEHDFPFVNPC